MNCENSSKTLKKIAGLRAKISNWLLLNTIQDSILNFVESKEITDQHQMLISFNLGKLPLLVQTSNTERIITKPA
jgi:UDP-N-acetylglucosamine transferase subunit ALG13